MILPRFSPSFTYRALNCLFPVSPSAPTCHFPWPDGQLHPEQQEQVKVCWAYSLIFHPQWLALEETEVFYGTYFSLPLEHSFTATPSQLLARKLGLEFSIRLYLYSTAYDWQVFKGTDVDSEKINFIAFFKSAYLMISPVHMYCAMLSTSREMQHNVNVWTGWNQ